VNIHVLGPLTAELNGRSVLPNAKKPKQILALLALYANQPLPVGILMEEIWSDRPPRTALGTLQTYILQLRRLIRPALPQERGEEAHQVLRTLQGSYLLRLEPASVDSEEFGRLSDLGMRAYREGELEKSVSWFRAAQSLWRGPALVDIQLGGRLEIEASRLEESRVVALERRIHAELRLRRHFELLTELSALTRHHPLHEGVHAQAMVAFYRAGRPAVSLEFFQTLRGRLVEELGIEPSPRLHRLQQAVLRGDPRLEEFTGTNELLERLSA
jgi:DNA-binding SARP family transcriptional activator